VFCDEIIPEGRQVCPNCEKRVAESSLKTVKKILWGYIQKHGTVIDNGNIDYVLEQAYKEYYGD
jgi:hypothetical protein